VEFGFAGIVHVMDRLSEFVFLHVVKIWL